MDPTRDDRRRPACPDGRRGRHGRGGGPRLPRPRRPARRPAPRLPPPRRRGRPGEGPRRRRPARRPASPSGALAGVPVAIKDVLCTKGEPDHLRQPDARGLPAALRRHRDPRLERGRRRPRRQDEHGRVRDGLVDREQRLRPDPQPLGPGAHPRRLLGRLGRGGRRRLRPALARLRHRRLDPPARRPLRDRRPQADLRPRQPLRPDRLRQLARPDRPVRPRPRRRRPAAERHRRPRPDGRDERRRAGARLPGRRSTPRPSRSGSAWSASSSARGSTPRSRRPSARRSGSTRRPARRSRRSRCRTRSTASPAYYLVAPAECSSNLARYDGTIFGHRAADFSPEYPGEEELPR